MNDAFAGSRSTSASVLTDLVREVASGGVELIDLTHTLTPDFPIIVLPPEFGQCRPFRVEEISHYDARGPFCYWNNFSMGEHTGTHFDAPAHWVTGRHLPDATVDTLPMADLIAPAVVIDISEHAAADADFIVTRDHLLEWEGEHGRIEAGVWLMLRTDWAKKVGGTDYVGLAEDGPHSPGPDAGAVEFLVHERGILGLGVETVGTDAGQAGHFDPPYPAHSILHGAGRYGLQCLANLDRLPTRGAVVFAAPLKIRRGSGSPLRVVALVPAAL